jgi:hypothetical protein
VRLEAGEAGQTLPAVLAVLAAMEQQYGPDARWLAEPLVLAAAVRTSLREYDAALGDLDRARSIAAREQLPSVLAEVDLQQAHVLWDSNQDRPRAHALARAAAESSRRSGALRSLAEAEQWIREHPLAP